MRSFSVDVAEYCRREAAAVDDSDAAALRSEWRLAAIMMVVVVLFGDIFCGNIMKDTFSEDDVWLKSEKMKEGFSENENARAKIEMLILLFRALVPPSVLFAVPKLW
jgi:hypothetical protein